MLTRLYDGGDGALEMRLAADSATWIAFNVADRPEAIYTGDHENIVLWPMNTTAAQTCTIALWEHTIAYATLANINRMIEVVWGAGDQIITTDRVIWNQVTGVEYACKGIACISVTPNVWVSMVVGASLGGDWWMRYSLGHAPLANFYD